MRMKTKLNILLSLLTVLVIGLVVSCDKVENPYPVKQKGELDESLYPGNFSDYVYPTFLPNTNTNRNVMLEDFTGHKCIFCPAAADTAHKLAEDFEDRVFVSTIHSGPNGLEGFQSYSSAPFTYNFTNDIGLIIGRYIGGLPSSGFEGNPKGTMNRKLYSSKYAQSANKWRVATQTILTENDLKVNLQAEVNYFEETKGAFIHIEADVLDNNLDKNNIGIVLAFLEDSIVKPQLYPSGSPYPNNTNDNYVHRDLLKLHLNGELTGTGLGDKFLKDGKYYFNYSFKIEQPYTAENAHFLIYAVDKVTSEIYQVIKIDIK